MAYTARFSGFGVPVVGGGWLLVEMCIVDASILETHIVWSLFSAISV
jgi:hypothetical protein